MRLDPNSFFYIGRIQIHTILFYSTQPRHPDPDMALVRLILSGRIRFNLNLDPLCS